MYFLVLSSIDTGNYADTPPYEPQRQLLAAINARPPQPERWRIARRTSHDVKRSVVHDENGKMAFYMTF